jgi:hypothetical protein
MLTADFRDLHKAALVGSLKLIAAAWRVIWSGHEIN